MPLPTPRKDEAKDKFIKRCMGNEEVKKFPKAKQQVAVCMRQWGEAKEVNVDSQLNIDNREFAESISMVQEGSETDDSVYRVAIIKEGMNLSSTRYYTRESLESMLPFVNGLQAYVDHPSQSESKDRWERSIRELLGWYSDPHISVESNGGATLYAKLHLLTTGPTAPISAMIKEAAGKGNLSLLGLSIRGSAETEKMNQSGRIYEKVKKVVNLMSTDAVTKPGAGGKFVSLAESQNEELRRHFMELENMSAEEIIQARPDLKETLAAQVVEPTTGDGESATPVEEGGKEVVVNTSQSVYRTERFVEGDIHPEGCRCHTCYESQAPAAEAMKDDDDDMDKDNKDGKKKKKKMADKDKDKDKDMDESYQPVSDQNSPTKTATHGEYNGSTPGKPQKNPDAHKGSYMGYGMDPDVGEPDKLKEGDTPTNTTETDNATKEEPAMGENDKNVTEAVVEEARNAIAELQRTNSTMLMESELAKTELPEPLKEQVRKNLASKAVVTIEEIQEAAAEQQGIMDRIFSDRENRQFAHVKITRDPQETIAYRLDAMLLGEDVVDGKGNTYEPFSGLIEAHAAFNGSVPIYGQTPNIVVSLMKESDGYDSPWSGKPRTVQETVSAGTGSGLTAWGTLFGDSMNRVLLRRYNDDIYEWEWAVSRIVKSMDIRPYNFSRTGEYAASVAVAEGADYAAPTSPTEEVITITPGKFGNIEDYTIEAMLRDDVQALREIPLKLASSFKYMQFSTVFNHLANNSNVWDGTALAVAAHNNHGTVALGAGQLAIAVRSMRSQANIDVSGKPIGLRPRYLIVPNELEETAYRLTTSNVAITTNQNATEPNIFYSKYGILPVTIDAWTDNNNWWVMADPRLPGVETFGVVTGPNGVTPMLTIQDDPSTGKVFTADKISFKVSGWFSASVLDYRPFRGAIVA